MRVLEAVLHSAALRGFIQLELLRMMLHDVANDLQRLSSGHWSDLHLQTVLDRFDACRKGSDAGGSAMWGPMQLLA